MHQKTTPRRVLTVDRTEVTGGPVTHDTQIHLTFDQPEEDIRLHCITIGNAPIILGLPWLKLHDPVIGWKNHTVQFHSDHCADSCLPSSPKANTFPEEKATEQYYKKMPAEEEKWEIGETDPWEVCQTVIDKIKGTSRTSKYPMPRNITSSSKCSPKRNQWPHRPTALRTTISRWKKGRRPRMSP